MKRDRLQLLSNENPELKSKRSQLIDEYESKYWTNREEISNSQIVESDQVEKAAFQQLEFVVKRKKLIKSKLKRLGLNQQEFGKILGHDSNFYA